MKNYQISKSLVICPLLPDQTGIAEFSERVFGNKNKFTTIRTNDLEPYQLAEILINEDFDNIIFVIGNSDHNLNIVDLLHSMKKFPNARRKIHLHVHDPVVSNIAKKHCDKLGIDFFKFYERSTGRPDGSLPRCIYKLYEDYGYTGLAYLLKDVTAYSIIFHSNAALKIIEPELIIGDVKIYKKIKLFHPCFEILNLKSQEKKYDLGVFGVMDDGGKRTNASVEIIKKLILSNVVRKVIFCGYNAFQYCESINLKSDDIVFIADGCTHEEMLKLMSQTRLAIQPRSQNTGESSGIVPMLLSVGCIPLVSNCGSFSEYPDEILYKVENENFVNDSVDIILNHFSERKNFDSIQTEHYLKTVAPEVFVSKLNEVMSEASNSIIFSDSSGLMHRRVRQSAVKMMENKIG